VLHDAADARAERLVVAITLRLDVLQTLVPHGSFSLRNRVETTEAQQQQTKARRVINPSSRHHQAPQQRATIVASVATPKKGTVTEA
jgi:hypothetical protein